MNLPRIDRLTLISAGSLLLAGVAGCSTASNQTATADNRPLGTSYGSAPYRRPGLQYGGPQNSGPQYSAPQYNAGPALDPGYAAEEYPDFRGNRKRFATGDGNPPPAQSDTEINEPARFPNENETSGADSADRRSFRETLHQKVSGLWHRRSSTGPANETVAQAPSAGGSAAPGWTARFDDNQLARTAEANARLNEAAVSDTGLIDLDAPLEKPQSQELPRQSPSQRLAKGIGPQERWDQRVALRRSLVSDEQAGASVALGNSAPGNSSAAGAGSERQALPSRLATRTSEKPPEWADRPQGGVTARPVSQQNIPSTDQLADGTLAAVAEPVRMADPPRLSVPPSGGDRETADRETGERENGEEVTSGLSVSKMVLCRQVRGFDDVAEIPPQHLRRGQPVLVYAALDNFLSIATAKGYRTLTLSTLEIRRPDGDVILRMPLGTAVDLSEAPRQDFFLTHRISIPENLPAGEYILSLRIDDLQARESSRSQLAVTVTGDHIRPDAAGDTSKFAIRPDSIQR